MDKILAHILLFVLAGEVVSDYHICKVGSMSNSMKCTSLIRVGSSLIGIAEAVERLSPSEVLELPPGYYTGSRNCGVNIDKDNVTVRSSMGLGRVIIHKLLWGMYCSGCFCGRFLPMPCAGCSTLSANILLDKAGLKGANRPSLICLDCCYSSCVLQSFVISVTPWMFCLLRWDASFSYMSFDPVDAAVVALRAQRR